MNIFLGGIIIFKKWTKEDKIITFIWFFMGVFLPILIFILVNFYVNKNIFKSTFLGDNVLLFYGTTIITGIACALNFMGLYYTLKQNSNNLKQQKKDLEDNFKKELKISKINELFNNITEAIINAYKLDVYFLNIDETFRQLNCFKDADFIVNEMRKLSLELHQCRRKVELFNLRILSIKSELNEEDIELIQNLNNYTKQVFNNYDEYVYLKNSNRSGDEKMIEARTSLENYIDCLKDVEAKMRGLT